MKHFDNTVVAFGDAVHSSAEFYLKQILHLVIMCMGEFMMQMTVVCSAHAGFGT